MCNIQGYRRTGDRSKLTLYLESDLKGKEDEKRASGCYEAEDKRNKAQRDYSLQSRPKAHNQSAPVEACPADRLHLV